VTYRVLVVDDHAPWRREVDSTLRASGRWSVVGEAVDGLDAVRQAEALTPDLILMDVGLPRLNGIEAAGRILSNGSSSRILFLSGHSSWAIVDAALTAGGRGYILKSDAWRDLLPAMDAVVEGDLFVGASLQAIALSSTARHTAGFYADDAALVEAYARFAVATLKAGQSLIVACRDPRRPVLARKLEMAGFDVEDLTRRGRYLWISVADVLSSIMVEGWPDETRLLNTISPLIGGKLGASARTGARVAACGEVAPTLWMTGNGDAAVRLEELWDELAKRHHVDTFCGYPSTCMRHGDPISDRICAAHSAVHSR
jgi:DNA-binding NarL/FixJ family response regulator